MAYHSSAPLVFVFVTYSAVGLDVVLRWRPDSYQDAMARFIIGGNQTGTDPCRPVQ